MKVEDEAHQRDGDCEGCYPAGIGHDCRCVSLAVESIFNLQSGRKSQLVDDVCLVG